VPKARQKKKKGQKPKSAKRTNQKINVATSRNRKEKGAKKLNNYLINFKTKVRKPYATLDTQTTTNKNYSFAVIKKKRQKKKKKKGAKKN
jgi:hypothetical protein